MLLLLVYFVIGVPDEKIVEREEDGDEGDANAVGDYCGHPYQLLVGLGLVQLLYEALGVLGQLDAVVHSVLCWAYKRGERFIPRGNHLETRERHQPLTSFICPAEYINITPSLLNFFLHL